MRGLPLTPRRSITKREIRRIIRKDPELASRFLNDHVAKGRQNALLLEEARKRNPYDDAKAYAELQEEFDRRSRLEREIREMQAEEDAAEAPIEEPTTELRSPDSYPEIETGSIGDEEEEMPRHTGRLHPYGG
jgi:hypothetical protein